jgi:beta-lactamase superfamily II metal-dependent hydrolase
LEVLAIGQRGLVLLLTDGRARVLLAPGADPDLAARLTGLQLPGAVTAVLLADGGFVAANPPAWLEQMHPLAAVISVEAADPRGLPSREVLQALEGTTVLRTDRNGWIELVTDGERLWISVERAPTG